MPETLRPTHASFLRAARLLVLACFVLVPAAPRPATAQPANVQDDTPREGGASSALDEGNHLFQTGRYEEAAAAYREGLAASFDPTLAYNLATSLHQLGRLPEAVLWYRRAERAGDPWLTDNLLLARRSLGSRKLPPAGVEGFLAKWHKPLGWTAAGLAWLALLGIVLHERVSRWATLPVAILALVLFAAVAGARHWGPRPAVLLQQCAGEDDALAAGSEVWVSARGDGYAISGTAVVCPHDAVGLVDPEHPVSP